ncbi:MAG TPA: YciI family protein [Streptosporangiaceae bacterium]|nr:YciI family protein [Streptosporangiaceae bacterium]
MAMYAMLLYYPQDQYWDSPQDAQLSAVYDTIKQDAARQGVLRGGEALHSPAMTTTITVADGPGGDVRLTDGPFAEAKEVLGGFFLLDVADLDEAVRWAARMPAAWRGKVEVRPVVPPRTFPPQTAPPRTAPPRTAPPQTGP